MSSLADRLRQINEHRESEVRILAPSHSDYLLGGAHRCWIKECAMKIALAYINCRNEIIKLYENPSIALTLTQHLSIPKPPQWNGVRPSEIAETYGHPHLANKDWRHFENTLRWMFAKQGYICKAKMTNDYEGIAFYAVKMMTAAHIGLPKISVNEETYSPPYANCIPPYKEFCSNLDESMADTKAAEDRMKLAAAPFALHPILAMSM